MGIVGERLSHAMDAVVAKVKNVLSNITVEPLTFLTYMIIFLGDVPTKEIYLQKACQVNLGYNATVCTDLTSYEKLQEETQEYVSGVQAYNGFLQRLPNVVFILFVGPLTDSFGRKPFLIVPLIGFFLLNLVLAVNSFWFQELKVEYLLLECVQDLTGGKKFFKMAAQCYIMDVTSVKSRTARICWLEATIGLAIMISSPLGAYIKNMFGFTALYSFILVLTIVALIGCCFMRESIELVSEEKKEAMIEEKEAVEIKCDRGVPQFCLKVLKTLMRSFIALFRPRPNRKHIWCFLGINCIAMCAEEFGGVLFMFYRLRYKIENDTFGWLLSAWAIGSFTSQTFITPLLSLKVGLPDTVIIMMGLTCNSLDVFIETLVNQVWVLFVCWGVLQMFWDCMFIITLSAISKLVEPTEVGKFLCLVELANKLIGVGARPAYNLIYQATLKTYPATALYVAIAFFQIALALTIYTHFDIKKKERRIARRIEKNAETKLPLKNIEESKKI